MWRLANSLVKLREQVNTAYPNRNKASDGTIGDTAHATSASDHNPNAQGVVTALDLTHDPANGLDIMNFAEVIKSDPRVKYLIANRLIWWRGDWYDYTGSNPHTKHIHISVSATPSVYDNSNDWKLGGNVNPEQLKQFHYWTDTVSNEEKVAIFKELGLDKTNPLFPAGQPGSAPNERGELFKWAYGHRGKIIDGLRKEVEALKSGGDPKANALLKAVREAVV